MKIIETGIDGLIVLEPNVYEDERGYFFEAYNKVEFDKIGIFTNFVQDNESKSTKNVLRGLHFQTSNPQAKLVRCSRGIVWDVAVDLRPDSSTFGKWYGVELSEKNKKMMFIPEKFAHGFVVLSEEAVFNYKCSTVYDASSDSGIMYNNEEINIAWPINEEEMIISLKDKQHILNPKEIVWK